MSKKVSLDLVLKLNELFKEKKWNEMENHGMVYENICQLSELLSDEENDLIIKLIEKYNWISYNDYNSKLNKLLKQIVVPNQESLENIYLFPIIKPEDQDKNKSGNSISYMMKCIKPSIKEASKISIIELTKFKQIAELKLKSNDLLVLVDDYVGSGETLNSTLTEVNKNTTVCKENLIICSLVIQSDTITKLLKEDYNVIYDESVVKGITQNYESPLKEKYIDLMLEIEKRIIPGRNFSLGYEESEALVTMIRTPDNTFPIFWHKYKKSTGLLPPFPRE